MDNNTIDEHKISDEAKEFREELKQYVYTPEQVAKNVAQRERAREKSERDINKNERVNPEEPTI